MSGVVKPLVAPSEPIPGTILLFASGLAGIAVMKRGIANRI